MARVKRSVNAAKKRREVLEQASSTWQPSAAAISIMLLAMSIL